MSLIAFLPMKRNRSDSPRSILPARVTVFNSIRFSFIRINPFVTGILADAERIKHAWLPCDLAHPKGYHFLAKNSRVSRFIRKRSLVYVTWSTSKRRRVIRRKHVEIYTEPNTSRKQKLRKLHRAMRREFHISSLLAAAFFSPWYLEICKEFSEKSAYGAAVAGH